MRQGRVTSPGSSTTGANLAHLMVIMISGLVPVPVFVFMLAFEYVLEANMISALPSCDGGNLELVVVRTVGNLIPHLALFAKRHIGVGEELCFSYGPSAGPLLDSSCIGVVGKRGLRSNCQPCLCGQPECKGYLPRAMVSSDQHRR
jgi:hypothetical protein